MLKAGLIVGYQGGRWVPGLANIQGRLYYLDQVNGADFAYNKFFNGVYVGFRGDFKKGWLEVSWNNKHSIFTSEYSKNGDRYKESDKARLNTFVICGGYSIKNWGLGCGIDFSNFIYKRKLAKVEDYPSTQWIDPLGPPVKLFGGDYPGFDICLERKMGKLIIIKLAYFFGIGHVAFTPFYFKPNTISLSLVLNLKKSKS